MSVKVGQLLSVFVWIFCSSGLAVAVSGEESQFTMARITGGKFTPIVKSTGKLAAPRDIKPFLLDRYPVTIRQFLNFVHKNPEWRRSKKTALFTDDGYLRHWESDLIPGKIETAPVTEVSWFAARSYCKALGKRLPLAAEWEYAGLASEREKDGSSNSAFTTLILHWYVTPSSTNRSVGSFKNAWGVYDMHGLIWEWVEDFNGEFTSGDSRGDNSQDESAFCGGSAINISDRARTEYATFMRYAFRGSLRGNYAINTLGFRCATDI